MPPVKQFLNVLLGAVIFGSTFAALSANVSDMDQLDEDDRQEFNAGIARATTCTKARDFECAAKQLNQANKFVNGSRDRTILQKAAESLELERQFAIRDDAKRKYSGERSTVEANADNAEKRLAENREANAKRALEERRRANVARERQREDEQQSTSEYNAAIGAEILRGINENGARLANIDRQTNAAYAETNRRLAAQAAERERVKAERDEHEAERRRDARRSEEARQSRERLAQADARDREDQRRKEAERAAERQREEQRRKDQQAQQERTRVSVSSSTSTATGSSAQKDGATKTRLPHQPYAEPNPYDKGFLGGNAEVGKEAGWSSHSAGNGQTREAACSEARKKSQQEIARLSAHWRFDATSPCVCSVNVSADKSMLDAMAETGEPDHWFCAMYEKKTQIRDLGSRSR